MLKGEILGALSIYFWTKSVKYKSLTFGVVSEDIAMSHAIIIRVNLNKQSKGSEMKVNSEVKLKLN